MVEDTKKNKDFGQMFWLNVYENYYIYFLCMKRTVSKKSDDEEEDKDYDKGKDGKEMIEEVRGILSG